MTADIDANIICVSDPVLALGGELGWFAGTRTQPLQRDLPNVLRHFLSVHPPQRVIFFGASGGGFASLYYSHGFPGSVALSINPQTKLANYTPAAVGDYVFKAWNATSLTEVPIVSDLDALYRDGFPNTIYLMQNMLDGHHRDRHLAPWMRTVPSKSERINLLMDRWGKGHAPPPSSLIKNVLTAIVLEDQSELSTLGFINAPGANAPARLYRAYRDSKLAQARQLERTHPL